MSDDPQEAATVRPRTVLLFYGGMSALALVWGAVAGRPNVFVHREAAVGVLGQATIGLVVGVAAVLLSRGLTRWFDWARRLNHELSTLLGPLSTLDILVMAGASAIGEEMLFRGAMQPTLGLLPTAFLFGLVHIPPRRDLWPWTIWALAAGILLGKLVEVSGSLLGPILAHFTINWFNLHALGERPTEP